METLLSELEPSLERSTKSEKPIDLKPLAARLRPKNFDGYIGQKHLLADGKLLKKAIESDTFSSIIFHGPPGVGKTSLAELIALKTNSNFVRLSGVISKVTDLRKEIKSAQQIRELRGRKTIIFIDEIHRFNKAQQDSLLPDIESGNIRFIGATTHNPHFFIIPPLLSRSLVFALNLLSVDEIKELLYKSIKDDRAFEDIEKNRIEAIPVYLKSSYCKSSGEVIDTQYKYPHDDKEHHVKQKYFGVKKSFYKPGNFGYERKIKERMDYWKSLNKK